MARAEKFKFKAIVLTLDRGVFALRWHNARYFVLVVQLFLQTVYLLKTFFRNGFTVPDTVKLGNFTDLPSMTPSVKCQPETIEDLFKYVTDQIDPSVTWKDVDWLQSITKLPVILKGILSPEDAKLAAKAGVEGIIVSNHGHRQLDGVLPTICALPDIVKAVEGKCEVYLDGGVREGMDIFRALALGAKMVFLGRPFVYGLIVDGQQGIEHVVEMLRAELKNTMALTGCSSIDSISPQHVVKIN